MMTYISKNIINTAFSMLDYSSYSSMGNKKFRLESQYLSIISFTSTLTVVE